MNAKAKLLSLETCAIFLNLVLLVRGSSSGRIVIDLSYTYDASTVYWPTERDEGFKFTKQSNSTDPITGEHYEANSFCTPEHGGTHLDAPSHFTAGKYGVDGISLERLVSHGVVVNVSDKTTADRNYEVQPSDFDEWERNHGEITKNSIVLIHTGWNLKLPNLTDYFGTGTKNESLLRFPGLSEQGANWLINKQIASVGIDTASIDYGKSSSYRAHKVLTAAEIPIFENVANLHLVPTKGAMIVALPMKIGRGSGAPLRMIAYYGNRKSHALRSRSAVGLVALLVITSTFVVSLFL